MSTCIIASEVQQVAWINAFEGTRLTIVARGEPRSPAKPLIQWTNPVSIDLPLRESSARSTFVLG